MKILCKIFLISIIFILPNSVLGFSISSLTGYQNIAVKTFVRRDSVHSNQRTIQATKDLEKILGQKPTVYETKYIYVGEQTYEIKGSAKYYYFYPPSYSGRGKGELKYETNDVMKSGQPGDIAVIAKKSPDEILLLIVQRGSPAEQELYSVLGIAAPVRAHKSWWKKLWSPARKQMAADNTDSDENINTPIIAMPAIPEKSWMRIYFTPGPDCENNIIASINDADARIDVAVYSITNDKIVDALLRAHRRGVRVRVISDRLQSHGKHSLIGRIEDAGIRVVLNKKHKIMHNKFAIFDARHIETGSYNWTNSATDSNAENCMFFPETGGEFTDQFKHLWDLYRG